MENKKWTITSPTGQVLYGAIDEMGMVSMSSAKGNHGQVTIAVWMSKIDQMVKLGYTVTNN